jgi:hypothetical protein
VGLCWVFMTKPHSYRPNCRCCACVQADVRSGVPPTVSMRELPTGSLRDLPTGEYIVPDAPGEVELAVLDAGGEQAGSGGAP